MTRSLTDASSYPALVALIFPARTVECDVAQLPETGPLQVLGILVVGAGAGLALWCVLLFAVVGRGTPVPVAPPTRLVVRGPYRIVRNPMAIGVGSVLAHPVNVDGEFPHLRAVG